MFGNGVYHRILIEGIAAVDARWTMKAGAMVLN